MIVILTGAGISKESGIATFRDSDGLWANHRIEDVCTPEALVRNRKEVIDFYNERRKELLDKKPNAAHLALAKLERELGSDRVSIITQNIDDLHERAGSKNITHLHGELRKLRSTRDENAIIPMEGWKQGMDDRHKDGSLLRPHVVFFGEAVSNMEQAAGIASQAELFVIIGSSLNVYPAAGLSSYVPADAPIFIVDPADPANVKSGHITNNLTYIQKRAAEGVPELVEQIIENYGK